MRKKIKKKKFKKKEKVQQHQHTSTTTPTTIRKEEEDEDEEGKDEHRGSLLTRWSRRPFPSSLIRPRIFPRFTAQILWGHAKGGEKMSKT